ncbi:MAG TPA: PfkB family carbohydrate kinase, partial [Victivallales bacterium]|nr:PfkB family carbohydrate kinase [Victivallales bacterium]
NDKYGPEILELLKALNCDTSGVKIKEDSTTTRKERVIAGSQQLLRIDYENTTPIKTIEIKDSLNKLINLIEDKKIDAVIVEDYAKGLINKTILRKIVDCCNKNKIICALDPHPSHPFNIKGITFMTPNRNEAMALSGINSWEDNGKNKKLYEAAQKLIKNWGLAELIITLGADGMALFKSKKQPPKIIPTKAREVFDVSGAGDTVIALYTLSIISGASSEEAAEIANYAAGVVVGKIGTATASEEEIIESFKAEGKK